MKYRLRAYCCEDEGQLNTLALEAFREYEYAFKDWEGFCGKIARMSCLSEHHEIIVAEAGNRLVGAVAYMPPYVPKAQYYRPEWAVMRMLVVAPQMRGRGIARTLSEMCMLRALRDDARIMGLHTSELMQVALSMYRKMGFAFYARIPDIHGVEYSVYTKPI